ncbi:hypothetical protein DHEL01_v202994 [Diaporthe helianthi]|uniref:Uncharacterized protein n=1 Tax=Diaporthe helianthi TaxID=158607 RepID=A0A2P5I7Y7_DIAHE|nr:hypothetical protein DHEL01_v202994 [Diaporthe helianthi]
MSGGGFGEVATVDAMGKWKEAVIRILKSAIMPNSWSYSISIGDGRDEKRLDSVYFLLDKSSEKLPEQVAITASSQYGGTKTATLKATRATLNTTIHHLAARAAVRDLESQDVPDSLSSDIIRKNAEHLRQTYSISSKWASFVAVSHLQKEASTSEYVEVSLYKAPRAEIDLSETSYRGNQSQTFAHAPPWTKLA